MLAHRAHATGSDSELVWVDDEFLVEQVFSSGPRSHCGACMWALGMWTQPWQRTIALVRTLADEPITSPCHSPTAWYAFMSLTEMPRNCGRSP
jgi:hypothetical protein